MAYKQNNLILPSSFNDPAETEQEHPDRRLFERLPVADGWNAVMFPADGNELYLSVEDVSGKGAGLMLPGDDIICDIKPGATLTLMIRSPNRDFTRSVEIRGIRQVGRQ